MKKEFEILSKDGENGTIIINNINDRPAIEFDIVKLQIGGNTIVENIHGTISYLTTDDNAYIAFKNQNKEGFYFLNITGNRELIDYVWNENGSNKTSCLYQYTTDHWRNWED